MSKETNWEELALIALRNSPSYHDYHFVKVSEEMLNKVAVQEYIQKRKLDMIDEDES